MSNAARTGLVGQESGPQQRTLAVLIVAVALAWVNPTERSAFRF
jgi:hypothetical protein